MRVITIPAPAAELGGDLVDYNDDRFADAWDVTMLSIVSALQHAFAELSGGGGRINVALPAGSGAGAVASAVTEGIRALVRSAALAWRDESIEVECIPPST